MVTAILTEDFPPVRSREAQWAWQLAEGLYKTGQPVVVLTRSGGERDKLVDARSAYRVIRMQAWQWNRFKRLYLAYYTLRFLFKYRQGCIIVSRRHLAGTAVRFPRRLVTIICDRHRDFEHVAGSGEQKRLHRIYRGARVVVAVSRYLKSRLEQVRVPVRDIRVIPDGVDIQRFKGRDKSPALMKRHKVEKSRIIMSVGDILERRGLDVVVKALPAVVKEVPRVHYLIVGKGPYQRNLVRLVDQLGLNDYVSFCGYVEDGELPDYFNLCDVYALPCREIPHAREAEALGLTLLEAAACGKPVIAGKSGGITETVVDGETGILVNPDDADTLSGALVLLLSDTDLAANLGARAREQVERHFTWDRYLNSMVSLVQEVQSAVTDTSRGTA